MKKQMRKKKLIDNDLADVFDGEGVGGEAVDELGLLLGDVEHGPPPLLLRSERFSFPRW